MLWKSLNTYFPKLIPSNPEVVPILQQLYANDINDNNHLEWIQALSRIFTGALFTGFTGREADYYLWNNNSNVYLYEFTWPTSLLAGLDILGWNRKQYMKKILLAFSCHPCIRTFLRLDAR
uniref:Uncharacterized protein n=1 Tax=Acrobeloides nanus TaxID=290746 RepID=A0A914E8L8_9BILA